MKFNESLKDYMIEELKAVFSCVLLLGLFAFFIFLIAESVMYVKKIECAKWQGNYHWSTGCVVTYKDTKITLDDYKEVMKMELAKPIPTNANIKLGAE